ncbi:MAG: carbon storage regulator CsrA, partial [Clostridiaceae bacterium]|nr:carbon storage regulator CsrA [Clostridiaceae bacterium]
MLVLSRKKGQSIMIGNDIEISIVDVQGEQVRLGINAPRDVSIHRKEVFEEIIAENRQAAAAPVSPDMIKRIKICNNTS